MDPTEIRNYGKSLLELMAQSPPEVGAQSQAAWARTLGYRLGEPELERFQALQQVEQERMQAIDVGRVAARGLTTPQFYQRQLLWASTHTALCQVVGEGRTEAIFEEVVEETGRLFFHSFPSPEEFLATGDAFHAFTAWFEALMGASREEGAFEFQVTEHSENAFQLDCTWCAWEATLRCLDAPDACPSICAHDDVFFPDYCAAMGLVFERSETLGCGGGRCDYRFCRSTAR